LIDEIFTRFLFPSVFHQDNNDKSQALTMTQVMDSKNQAT
jgi:ubiquitin carboxyl-terminal hydrolase 34